MLPEQFLPTSRQYVTAILLSLVAIAFVQLKTPPVAHAQGQTENNTAVFSGQFIPAFIGSAYDPSEAYRRMAGLPVYVFSYDSWSGGTFIINNLAVRTQIRADGSFQAQGLPNGQKFGVYFPYRYNTSTNRVDRSDCLVNTAAPTKDPCHPDKQPRLGDNTDFRMPQLQNLDGIGDVFSYNLADAIGLNNIQTQIEIAPGEYEEIQLGLTFLTQETRVDIENNINTFPLIPTSTIRVTVDIESANSGLNTDAAYEVRAQRVVYNTNIGTSLTTGYDLVNSPIISGRTIYPQVYTTTVTGPPVQQFRPRIFQAYAPPGVYVITVWVNEGGVAYNEYEGNIHSQYSGFAVTNIPYNVAVGTKQDWSSALDINEIVVARRNSFVVWGRTVGPDGRISLSETAGGNPIPIEIHSESNRDMLQKRRNTTGSGCILEFWNRLGTPCTAEGDSNNNNIDFVHKSYGVFAFYSEILGAVDSAASQVDRFGVNFNDPTSSVDPNPVWTDTEIYSTQGPVQIDLAEQPDISSGVLLKTTLAGTSPILSSPGDEANLLGTRAIVRPTDLLNATITADVPAFGKTYLADHLGRIHIPAADLAPGYDYSIIVSNPLTSTSRVDISFVTSTTFVERDVSLDLSHLNTPVDNSYKILGFIPANYLIPNARQASAAILQAQLPIQVHDANVWESLTVKNVNGNILFSKNQNQLAANTASKPYTLDLLLPFLTDEECENFAGLENDETCKAFLEEANTFDIQIVADSNSFTKRFITEMPAGSAVALVKDPAWNLSTKDPCNPDAGTVAEGTEPVTANAFTSPLGFWAQVKQNFRAQNPGTVRALDTARAALSEEGLVGAAQSVFVGIGCEVTATVTPLVGSALVFIKDLLILEPLTTNTGVVSAWDTMRAIANIFFVFILLAVGINHALGYDRQNWSANVLLPELLKAIVFANLSLLLVQGILDINNVLTTWIFALMANILNTTGISAGAVGTVGSVGASAAVLYFLGQLFSVFLTVGLTSAVSTGGFALLVIIPLLASAILFLFGLVVVLLGILFGRYLIIWLGVVIAPVAFAISVLPWFRQLKGMWWSLIIPVAFTQTVMAAIIFVGVLLMTRDNMGDSILTQIGTFLIGAGILYASIKSPQYTASILGKGLGSSLLGGVTDVANRAVKPINSLAGKAASLSSPAGLQNFLLEREAEQAEYDVRFADQEGDSRGTRARKGLTRAISRVPIANKFVRQGVDIQKTQKAISKKAEKAAQAGAAPLPSSAQDVRDDKETAVLQGVIQRDNKLAPVQFKAQENAAMNYAHDNASQFNLVTKNRDKSYSPTITTVPNMMKSALRNNNVSEDDIKKIFKENTGKGVLKAIRKQSPEAYREIHGNISTSVSQNTAGGTREVTDPNTGQTTTQKVNSSYDLLRKGFQREQDIVRSQKVEIPDSSNG